MATYHGRRSTAQNLWLKGQPCGMPRGEGRATRGLWTRHCSTEPGCGTGRTLRPTNRALQLSSG
eukprot:13477258-Alexandrium_andersonii.AAC.1